MPDTESFDVVVVGAGFAGLYALYRLREMGLSVRVLEAGSDVGGTWFWNRYPGCRCDVESIEYSFSFSEALQREWDWSERYAPAAEIREYARHVAERFDLYRDIDLDTRVTSATWADGSWRIETETGGQVQARICVMATGVLSAGQVPDLPGLADFAGETCHTSTWPAEGVDLSGKRVAVMGTGSSGVQAIPEIAQVAERLHVLLRTPNYVVPARNAPLHPAELERFRFLYPELRQRARNMRGGALFTLRDQSALEVSAEERQREFERRWRIGGAFNIQSAFNDIQTNPEVNAMLSDFIRGKIGEIVEDPDTAEALKPPHLIGTRRLCVGTDFYETFNRPNVDLIDLRETPFERFTDSGFITGGTETKIDTMVFATGYDAITGALSRIVITGRDGRTLAQHWQDGARAHLGLMPAGFPNLFLLTGPGSPAVLSNVIVSIEQHVDWMAECLAWLREKGRATIEATQAAEQGWVDHVRALGEASLLSKGSAWYLGVNVPGKPRVFLPYAGGVPRYREECAEVAADGYRGFVTR